MEKGSTSVPTGRWDWVTVASASLDLRGGSQPMSNEDGTLWVVFNGEIYNFPELRKSWKGRDIISPPTATPRLFSMHTSSTAKAVWID